MELFKPVLMHMIPLGIGLFATLFTTIGTVACAATDAPIAPAVEVEKAASRINKLHILYLLRAKEFDKSIDLYREYKNALGSHDFEIIQPMATILLEQGI